MYASPMTPKLYLYRTLATDMVKGFMFKREDGRMVKVEKVYPLHSQPPAIFVRDDSGTMGRGYPLDHVFEVYSDN